MGRALGSSQHRVARQITGGQLELRVDRIWEYPPLETAVKGGLFEEMGAYVPKSQNTVTHYILTRPIMDLCEGVVRRAGEWVARRWWEK